MAEKKTSDEGNVTTTKTTFRTKATASPRSLVITRTSGRPLGAGASSGQVARTMVRRDVVDSAFAEGAYANQTATGVSQVKLGRDQEKKDMQDLNDRFSDYISKV